MRRTRRSRRSIPILLVPLLLAAGCADGGAAPVAQPHELRLTIVHGKGIRDTVRASAQPADLLQDDSVVVRVSAQLDAGGEASATGPARAARIPPVQVVWRTLDPWCQAEHSSTVPGRGNTASNRLRMPTVAGDCRLVAEGVVNGFVFAADTAVAGFAPGPVASFFVRPLVGVILPFPRDIRSAVSNLRDEHGNRIAGWPGITMALTSAPPSITADDTLIRASAEGVAKGTVRSGTVSHPIEIWAVQDIRGDWRLSWACHDAPLAGGAHADSAQYRMERAEAAYGSMTARGPAVRFIGTLTTRMWVRGEPVRESSVPYTLRFAAQRPGALEWAPGELSAATPTGYAGGSLCEPGPGGSSWTRSSPVRADRL